MTNEKRFLNIISLWSEIEKYLIEEKQNLATINVFIFSQKFCETFPELNLGVGTGPDPFPAHS